MPELPEVETTRRGLLPHLQGQRVENVVVRNRALRWPVPRDLSKHVSGREVQSVGRRGKYLLIGFANGSMIVHLGMSGSLRVVPASTPPGKHDHFDLVLASGVAARLTDPRRFGAVLWESGNLQEHALLAKLAPEPLGDAFDAGWMHAQSRGRTAAIKSVVMDSHIVTGVGNIYASEALFRAGIHPGLAAGKVSMLRCEKLVAAIRETLAAAIEAGGSSLRDYVGAEGRPGYFQQNYFVYGRKGEPCRVCGTAIKALRQGQRSTFFCPTCQHR
ncbi:MAG TPA: bifunctional DNA-formamidopyrimidine glycosylase/DNA-(apurinic or apyrimidinic site) lyase [Burkholderiales bacterium]|nr:bifunctional DNA-formamidopyrimidine glycosylase/DNA-(apurinic or apyrimidinic site) lyase [Burkholderiales bacterium]